MELIATKIILAIKWFTYMTWIVLKGEASLSDSILFFTIIIGFYLFLISGIIYCLKNEGSGND